MGSARKPKLGQNFLIDRSAQARIVDALGDVSTRTVVEIGPGHGAITDLLAPRTGRLILVELDRSLAAELRFRFRDHSNVQVVEADILTVDLQQFAPAGETLDVVGNLPYYITSDILLHLFAASAVLHRAVLMMQREVADRVSARPGVRDYGLLSATTELYAHSEALFTLPPCAFSPPPDVYSTVLRLQFAARFAELQLQPDAFYKFLRAAFAQKRKTLRNNLQFAGYAADKLDRAWPVSLPPQVRAEAASLESMAELFRALEKA